MKTLPKNTLQSSPRTPRLLMVFTLVLVVTGIFFRAYALDRKVYGFDETATLLRVAGTTLPALDSAVTDGTLHSTAEVRARFQRLQPGTNAAATIQSLIVDDPQHPPLYYVLERFWQYAGTSIAIDRALAVLFGIALLPAAWWLARQLFGDVAASVMLALVAVSPFHVLFAQYNREYSLWALLATLLSAVFLAALRGGGGRWWAAYALCAALGMYTDPLFVFVLIAHVLYFFAPSAKLVRTHGRAFAGALLATLASFTPWIVVLASRQHFVGKTTTWNAVPLPPRILLEKWFFEASAVFFDAEYGRLKLVPIALLVAALVAAAACAAALWEPRRRALGFALLLALVPTLPFVVADLLFHTSRSTAARYLTPGWIGLELLVSAGLGSAFCRRRSIRVAASGAFGVLAIAGTYSLRASSQAPFWWIDSNDSALVPITAALEAMTAPKICYEDDSISILIVSDMLAHPIGLVNRPEDGCLAIATTAGMSAAPGGSGAFAPVPIALSPEDRQFAELHAATAKAHDTVYEPLTLWRRKPGQSR